jgi:hypothetical protein
VPEPRHGAAAKRVARAPQAMLSIQEAAGLRGACKALKGLVRGWPMRLGDVGVGDLEAALSCLPATESLEIAMEQPLAPAEESRVVEVLRGHGGTLKRVKAYEEAAEQLLSSAVRVGALPNLTYFEFSLQDPSDWEILSGGMLPLLEEVQVGIKADDEDQVAALEHVRRLEHLQRLRLMFGRAREAAFPPFIPPSLKALLLFIHPVETLEALLRELPSMLQASGVGLEMFYVAIYNQLSAEGGAALAHVLHTCSSTLKTVHLQGLDSHGGGLLGTACIPELVAGLLRCCATLEVLWCPWSVFSALPATCPTFPRLTKLCIDLQKGRVDCTSPAWDIMATGRLPALASLKISHPTGMLWGQGGGRLARALEAVGGTLRKLSLSGAGPLGDGLPSGNRYELGAAIGKLRRLRFLKLQLFSDGRDYHAVGEGLAASGGCPELVKVKVHDLSNNVDWLTYEPSLILPSVRKLWFDGFCTEEEALLLCCGLVQMGYKHSLTMELCDPDRSGLSSSVTSCMDAILGGGGVKAVWVE